MGSSKQSLVRVKITTLKNQVLSANF